MVKKQHYMTERERYKLETYLEDKKPVAWIAQVMGFCRQTIYNEIRRGQVQVVKRIYGYYRDAKEYSAEKAQQIHNYNQTAKGKALKIGRHKEYADRLEALMLGVQADGSIDHRARFSPAAAIAQAKEEGFAISVCRVTLYSYIEKGVFLNLSSKDLMQKKNRKRRYRTVQRIAHPRLPSIENRPEEINQRSEPGHWEMDLIIGKKTSGPCLLTMTDRHTRKEIIIKLPNKSQESVLRALRQIQEPIRSITTDNGSEFLSYMKMRTLFPQLQEIYYCHSYASWEKGTNEVHNRMIRRWFPKGTDFSEVSQEEIDRCCYWMNHYPRKVLGWRCPAEVMHCEFPAGAGQEDVAPSNPDRPRRKASYGLHTPAHRSRHTVGIPS